MDTPKRFVVQLFQSYGNEQCCRKGGIECEVVAKGWNEGRECEAAGQVEEE